MKPRTGPESENEATPMVVKVNHQAYQQEREKQLQVGKEYTKVNLCRWSQFGDLRFLERATLPNIAKWTVSYLKETERSPSALVCWGFLQVEHIVALV